MQYQWYGDGGIPLESINCHWTMLLVQPYSNNNNIYNNNNYNNYNYYYYYYYYWYFICRRCSTSGTETAGFLLRASIVTGPCSLYNLNNNNNNNYNNNYKFVARYCCGTSASSGPTSPTPWQGEVVGTGRI